jgi:excisionase family DNA binding protein
VEQVPLELMTVVEVAVLLRLKRSSIYAAAASGRLPSVCLWRGRRKSLLRFRRADIEALIAGPSTSASPSSRLGAKRSDG